MSQPIPLRVVSPMLELAEPPSVRMPDGVRPLPRLVIPDTRVVVPSERAPQSGLRMIAAPMWLLVLGSVVALAMLVAWSSFEGVPSRNPARSAEAVDSAHHCEGGDLQSRMCEVAWQGSLVSAPY